MCLRRAKIVFAHTSFLHFPVITTFVLPCTAPAGQAIDCHEGTTFKSPANTNVAKISFPIGNIAAKSKRRWIPSVDASADGDDKRQIPRRVLRQKKSPRVVGDLGAIESRQRERL